MESFIENRRLDPDSNDIRSVGSVMMELMEPETFILKPHSVVLRKADVCMEGRPWYQGFPGRDAAKYFGDFKKCEFQIPIIKSSSLI